MPSLTYGCFRGSAGIVDRFHQERARSMNTVCITARIPPYPAGLFSLSLEPPHYRISARIRFTIPGVDRIRAFKSEPHRAGKPPIPCQALPPMYPVPVPPRPTSTNPLPCPTPPYRYSIINHHSRDFTSPLSSPSTLPKHHSNPQQVSQNILPRQPYCTVQYSYNTIDIPPYRAYHIHHTPPHQIS